NLQDHWPQPWPPGYPATAQPEQSPNSWSLNWLGRIYRPSQRYPIYHTPRYLGCWPTIPTRCGRWGLPRMGPGWPLRVKTGWYGSGTPPPGPRVTPSPATPAG